MPVETKKLRSILQNAHKGFAYELLALEIEVESAKDLKNEEMIVNLTKLIQLYMLGVEVLESNFDIRYKYFNDKIQGLMKKRHVIQQLHLASTGDKNVPKQALIQANNQMRETRKNQYELNIFLNKDQCNIRRVKQIVEKQETKLQNYKNRLKNSLEAQQKLINQRIKTRKMKSQCYSARKFDIGSNAPEQKLKQVMLDNEDIFGPNKNKDNYKNGRRSSGQKKKLVLNV